MSESTAMAVAAPQTAVAWDGHLNQAQLDLFNRACHGATPDEAKLLFQTAAAMGLNPVIGGYIHGVKRWDGRAKREVMQIQVGIGGYRLCALRTGEYEGRLGPEFCGEDGEWRLSWPHLKPPVAARVGIRRRGFPDPIWHVSHYREAVQTDKEGQPNRTWSKMPLTMLSKTAEAGALRAAFPDLLSGTYAPEELGETEASGLGIRTATQTEDGDYLPAATPLLLEARKTLLALFSTEQRCRSWVLQSTSVDLEQLPLEDVRGLIRRAEAAKAKQAATAPPPAEKPAEKPADAKRLKSALAIRRAELFGKGDTADETFWAWCDRNNLLAFDTDKQRPSVSNSTEAEIRECLDAMKALTEEAVAEFAEEIAALEQAAESAFGAVAPATAPGREPWDA